jgi:N-acetylglucosamine-6-phosphate deacetylase
MLIKNAKIILPQGETTNGSILIEGESIAAVFSDVEPRHFEAQPTIDLKGAQLVAGFIDIHNHGAVGADVNTSTAKDLREISRFLSARGVTAWLPTLVPDSDENYRRAIDAIHETMKSQKQTTKGETTSGARILGVHYEGVFANEKMCRDFRRRARYI